MVVKINKDKELKLNLESLRRIVDYDPHTGDFWWIEGKKGRDLSIPAGSIDSYGYKKISIAGIQYSQHRLAWFYINGEWPPEYIDHIDGNPSNNAYNNLRLATAKENSRNKKRKYNSFTGIKGVVKDFASDTWHVHMSVDGQVISRGPFYSYQKACAEYDRLASEAFGEFYRPEIPRQQRATFSNKEVTQAVEEFIRNKTLINGRYE